MKRLLFCFVLLSNSLHSSSLLSHKDLEHLLSSTEPHIYLAKDKSCELGRLFKRVQKVCGKKTPADCHACLDLLAQGRTTAPVSQVVEAIASAQAALHDKPVKSEKQMAEVAQVQKALEAYHEMLENGFLFVTDDEVKRALETDVQDVMPVVLSAEIPAGPRKRTPTDVTDNTELGELNFKGYSSGNLLAAALISGEVSGTPTASSVPGRLLFKTTNELGITNEHMRIMPDGKIGIETTSPNAHVNIEGSETPGADSVVHIGLHTTDLDSFVLDTPQSLQIDGNLQVGGATQFSGTVTLDSLDITNDLSVGGSAGLGSLNVNNNATIEGTLGVTGATTLAGLTATNASLSGTLGVTGAATLSSTLGVTGNTTLGGTLGVTGATTLAGLSATNASLSGTLGVTGAATLSSTLGVTGNATLGGTLGVTGATTLAGLSATNASLSGTLGVTGATTLSTLSTSGAATLASVGVTNNATVGGTLGVTGATTLAGLTATNASLSGTLGVTGATTLSTLSTSGAATLASVGVTNNATVGGTLGVTGATTLAGLTATNASLSGTLGVTGAATLSSTLGVTGNTTLGGTLGVTGATTLAGLSATNASLSGTLGVTGAATLSSTLGVTGNTTLGGTLGVTGATTLAGLTAGASTLTSLGVTNNTTVGGTLGVTGATTVNNLTVNGTLTTAGAFSPTGDIILTNTDNNNSSERIYFQKSHGVSTSVQNGDYLGVIGFEGYDGSVYRECAEVVAVVDGTPSSGNVPGALSFRTSSTGFNNSTQNPFSDSLVERLRISAVGEVGIPTVTSGNLVTISGASATTLAVSHTTPASTVVQIGDVTTPLTSGTVQLQVQGDVQAASFVTTSDERLKTNIQLIDTQESLVLISKLQPKTFDFTSQAQQDFQLNVGKNRGFIAQEVKEVVPSIVSVVPQEVEIHGQKVNDLHMLSYMGLIPDVVGSIQALDEKISKQARYVDSLVHRILELEARLQVLENK